MARILFYQKKYVIRSVGGAEKIMITYANEFARRGHDVIFATLDEKEGEPFYKIDDSVQFTRLYQPFSLGRRIVGELLSMIGLIGQFPSFHRERCISKRLEAYCHDIAPDIIVMCGTDEMTDLVAHGEYDCPLIMMMHSHPKQYLSPKKLKQYRSYINKIDVIQVLLPSFVPAVPDFYHGKVVCIGNPVEASPPKEQGENIIIYVARVSKSKQHNLLIDIFAKIAAKHPSWQLHLYGCTQHKKHVAKCQNQIKDYGLEDRIVFKGTVSDVPSVLQKAKICAFPSSYEGFGLAMTEAMSLGLPVVGFDYCTGVNEIIETGVNGFLVKDVDEFAQKLSLLIEDEVLREALGDKARNIAQTFSYDKIINQWDQLLRTTMLASNATQPQPPPLF